VFSVALSLALGVLSSTSPVASPATGAVIAVCFSTEKDSVAFSGHAIDAAERRILITSYTLIIGSGIVAGLVRGKQRSVHVKLIADKTAPCECKSEIEEPTANSGDTPWC
jgi:hypothetical protein